MATTTDHRVAPAIARDGVDTRTQDNSGMAAAGTGETTSMGAAHARGGQTAASEEEEIRNAELDAQRDTLATQYRLKRRILEVKCPGMSVVYPNQQVAANEIIANFMAGKVWVVLIAPPGAGKTGVMLEVLRQLGGHIDPQHQIHINDMLVITGMSDTDWAKTMKDGMLDAFAPTIHHRAMLRRKGGLDTLTNGIIVTDECHVACMADQTIDKKLKEANLKDIDILRRRNMRMLDVSATPEGVLHDLQRWREHTAVVVLQPDEKYQGFQKMRDEGRLLNAGDYDLEDYERAKALLRVFQDRYRHSPTKKYFPFRIYSDKARSNVVDACRELGWDFESHDSVNRVEDIDAVMEKPPTRHKVFFVKGFWRASKRLVRKHVGGSYEAPTIRPDDTAKSQGLTARFCSTFVWEGEQTNVGLRPLHFDDIESIDRYLEWTRAGYDYKEAAYKAPRLRSDGEGVVKHPNTKARPEGFKGVECDEDPVPAGPAGGGAVERQRAAPTAPRVNRSDYVRKHKEFGSAEAARDYYEQVFGTTDGFASRPHRDETTGKFVCSFSNVKSSVCPIDVVRSRLGTGNLWGETLKKLDANQFPRIGTLKIGYDGETAVFVLCVCSKAEFAWPA